MDWISCFQTIAIHKMYLLEFSYECQINRGVSDVGFSIFADTDADADFAC